MSTTAQRTTHITFTGDVELADSFVAAANANSPGQTVVMQLASGANVITPPSSSCTTKAVTILPPATNTADITLKGTTADVGIVLHNTDPTTIALDSPTTILVLSAASTIDGVRLIWT
jgi:hypothetical protein